MGLLFVSTQPIYAQESPAFEKIRDVSPDRKFAKGDVRNECVDPVRWVKPGVLLLEQFDIFRDGNGEDATYQFTAKFDESSGKFQIT